ncbi:hypothetical protein Fmac_005560 [Flemingia macrophylla]|uniref:Peroxidase n=1 Tax=Flemingia macrophylla TaxID=520843 RepID=A0ABD1N877_9FABA
MTSYSIPLFLSLSLSLSLLPLLQSELTRDYYQKTCPKFSHIVNSTVTAKQLAAPTTAAATLQLFFHDCMVGGCDASILVTSNSYNKAERDAEVNVHLSGDAFDAVARAKAALEMECPGVASCADILATAAAHLVAAVGGPAVEVPLGRKDSVESKSSSAEKQFPLATMAMSEIISIFSRKGFSVGEMVALGGAHTIGLSHCKEFSKRIFEFREGSEVDPAYNPGYAEGLRKLCANYTKDPSMSAFNDVMTPTKFDNVYFKNLRRGLGLLASDSAMFGDPRTRPFVDTYANDQTKFFQDFSLALSKLSSLQVKTGSLGEVRTRCDSFNSLP